MIIWIILHGLTDPKSPPYSSNSIIVALSFPSELSLFFPNISLGQNLGCLETTMKLKLGRHEKLNFFKYKNGKFFLV